MHKCVYLCSFVWTDHLPKISNLRIYEKLYVHVQTANSNLNAEVYFDHGVLTIFPKVMFTSNLWTDAGLVNGAMGTVQAICYQSGGPFSLPVAVMVRFDKYWGPTLHDGSVLIVPQRRT